MALFEFEDGHLVPAQFGYPVAQDLGPDLVDAICQQVLQIVSRPLFPVTWRDMTGQDDEETPRLTALDVTGQIVSVEILKELDSETLITSLSRLAEVASISWSDLAAEYPSGPEGFRAGWTQFRDSMPPAVGPGPRLIMVAGDIDPSVRPALSVLATSGVEVHLMNLRQMSNGRLFLDVNAVGPRLYGHAPQLLASATAAPELAAATEQATPFEESVPTEAAIPAPPEESAEASNEEDSETPTTRPTPKVAPHLREVFTYPIDEEPPAPFKPVTEESSTEDSSDDQPTDEQSTDEAVEASRDEAELKDEQPESEPETRADEAAGVEDAEGTEDAERVAESDESAEPAVEAEEPEALEQSEESEAELVEDSEGAEAELAELADELLDHEDDAAQEAVEAQEPEAADEHSDIADEHEAADENADDVADESDVDAHDDAEAPADEPRPEEAPEQVDDQQADDHQADEQQADDHQADEPQADEQPAAEEDKPRWERPAHMSRRAARRAREESEELNDGGATDAATASSVDRSEESPEVAQARAEGLPVLGRDEAGLRTLAEILGQDTPLVARSELGLPADLVLAASGAISGAGLTYPSLDTLLTARGLGHIDAWGQVRIGDRLGPTLAEALDEINREIVREYAQAPRGQHSAKH